MVQVLELGVGVRSWRTRIQTSSTRTNLVRSLVYGQDVVTYACTVGTRVRCAQKISPQQPKRRLKSGRTVGYRTVIPVQYIRMYRYRTHPDTSELALERFVRPSSGEAYENWRWPCLQRRTYRYSTVRTGTVECTRYTHRQLLQPRCFGIIDYPTSRCPNSAEKRRFRIWHFPT